MANFTKLVDDRTNTDLKVEALKSVVSTPNPIEQIVFHHTVVQLILTEDMRELAKITADYIRDCEFEIHEETRLLLNASPLRLTRKYGVGYPLTNGKWGFFQVGEVKDSVQDEDPVTGIVKDAMRKLDWYYHFTDYHLEYERGKRAYNELIKLCKSMGFTQEEARELQREVFAEEGNTKMEGVAIIKY